LLLRLEQWESAEATYADLMSVNPDHRDYHVGLQKATLHINAADFSVDKVTLSDEQTDKLVALYEGLRSKYPKAALVQSYPLSFFKDSQIDKFKAVFTANARVHLEKGIPSFWNSSKPLYKNPKKVAAMEELALQWLKNLRTIHKFDAADAKAQAPSTELWLELFIAQHYNKLNQHQAALEHIDAAIKHTPTCLDAYLFKARIMKHAGAPVQAAELVNKARELDLADRYLNNKATLYLLRAGKIEEAQKLIDIFTKIEANTYNNVFEMQVSWYEQAEGESWVAKGDFGRALKRFTDIESHFKDFVEDQVDFHTYNIRKSILRNYIHLLRFEDKIQGHDHFVRAAQAIVETNLRVIDAPSKADLEDLETAGMSEEDKKAYLQKKKRQANKEKARQASSGDKEKLPYKKCYGGRCDWDPEGEKLVKDASLEKCVKYAGLLQKFASSSLRSQILICDVHTRREKLLLALRALKKAVALAPRGAAEPSVHAAIVKFLNTFHAKASSINATVKQVIETEITSTLKVSAVPSAQEYNDKYLADYSADYESRFHAVKSAVVVLGQKTDTHKARLLDLASVSGYPLQPILAAYHFMQQNWPKSDADAFKEAAHKKFPLMEAFSEAPAASATPAENAADGEDPSAEPQK
jgi:N-alpha-acetyltransferase 15/16, NatA auxiliary subunit